MTRIHNYSEYGKLNTVLLHRIGPEVEGLVPDNFSRLLFDDIPYLKVAMAEHDAFADLLRENGVEVLYYADELTRALSAEETRRAFLREFVRESRVSSQTLEAALLEYLGAMPAEQMVRAVISGVRRRDLPDFHSPHFADFISASSPFLLDPMPNLYFTRDPGACVGGGICIHHMHTQTRRRESLLLEYIFRALWRQSDPEARQWYDYDDPFSIEGGDILVLDRETVAVGLSQRTTAMAIELFARKLLMDSDFQRLVVFEIPKSRAFMHLDTVFTVLDRDKFVVHPEIEEPLRAFEMVPERDGEVHFSAMTGTLEQVLKSVLRLSAVDLIRCGGDDPMTAQREQWNDGANTLAIAPGVVITYERNHVTNELLERHGVRVLTIPSSELSRGRGGPRCMSCPVNRDDLA